MKISIDFETTIIKHMLKPGTEIKVILPTNPGEEIICYINGDEAHDGEVGRWEYHNMTRKD